MSQNKYDAGLPLWTVASKYFNMAMRTATEIAVHGNPSSAVNTRPLTAEEIQDRSKWSDTDLSVPLLFSFYHGLEVMIKGFLMAEGQPAKGHKLSKLLDKTMVYHPDEPAFQLMSNYINPSDLSSPLKEFFENNEITPDMFYEALKYPETNKGKTISHIQLKYGGSSTVGFYNQLAQDAERISKSSAILAHTLYHNTVPVSDVS